MAKRFIDTDFFKDPFVRGLQGPYKGLYIYLFLECNNVGIWQKELDIAKLRCGISDSVSDAEIYEIFKEKIVEFNNGQKWFLKNFIKIQHGGTLSENNKAHKNFLPELIENNFVLSSGDGIYFLNNNLDNKKEIQGACLAPSQGAKVMVKEEGNGLGNIKEKPENFNFKKQLIEYGFEKQLVTDWLIVRKTKRASNTKTAFDNFIIEIEKTKKDKNELLKIIVGNSWQGFNSKWILGDKPTPPEFVETRLKK
jgi:hypothetical protein